MRHGHRHHEVGADESAARVEEPVQDGRGAGPGRVGDHVERAPGQTKIGHVGADDAHVVGREAASERVDAPRVELEGDDGCAPGDQVTGDGARPGADVEDQVSRSDP